MGFPHFDARRGGGRPDGPTRTKFVLRILKHNGFSKFDINYFGSAPLRAQSSRIPRSVAIVHSHSAFGIPSFCARRAVSGSTPTGALRKCVRTGRIGYRYACITNSAVDAASLPLGRAHSGSNRFPRPSHGASKS